MERTVLKSALMRFFLVKNINMCVQSGEGCIFGLFFQCLEVIRDRNQEDCTLISFRLFQGTVLRMLQSLFKLSPHAPALKSCLCSFKYKGFHLHRVSLSSLAKIPFLAVPLLTGSCLYECITAFSKLNYGKQFAVGCCQPWTGLQKQRGREAK